MLPKTGLRGRHQGAQLLGDPARFVLLSSATVYGAWANNPVPLTEAATLRPNPELEFAVRAAERERIASDWKDEHPGAGDAGADGFRGRGHGRRRYVRTGALEPGISPVFSPSGPRVGHTIGAGCWWVVSPSSRRWMPC